MKKKTLPIFVDTIRRQTTPFVFFIVIFFLSAILFPVFWRGAVFFIGRSTNLVVNDFEQAIYAEERILLEQAKDLANNNSIRAALRKRDSLSLISLTNAEAKSRGIGGILVADNRGLVLSRLLESARRGDYIFNTTAWGRMVADGNDVASIERGSAVPFLMIGATQIKDSTTTLGVITASNAITNDLAQRLKDKYLDSGQELSFYLLDKGVVASSIKDDKTSSALASYSSFFADIIKNGMSEEHFFPIRLESGYFNLGHIILRGSDGKPIGLVIILLPSQPMTVAIIFATILTIIFFLSTTLLFYYKNSILGEKRTDIYITALSLVLFVLLFFLFQSRIKLAALNLTPPPFAIYNSTMNFEPEYNVVSKGSEQQVDIIVASGGEAINAVTAVIDYDPLAVKVKEIISDQSFCSQDLFLEKNIDEEHGQVTVSCLAPNPGFAGSKGIVASLAIQPLKNGFFSLKFGKDTQVLANDGLGTNVLRRTDDGSYQVSSEDLADAKGEQALIVFSPSHPNRERRYRDKTINFSWVDEPNRFYKYNITQLPDFVPDKEPTTTEHLATVRVKDDGTYYFHLVEMTGDGAVVATAHYPVTIDATPPPPPVISLSSDEIAAGEVVRADLRNQDTPSSTQPGFYIKIDGGVFLPVRPPLFIPFISRGNYQLTARVFDKAGNASEAVATVHVR